MSKLINDSTIVNAAQQAVITRAALAELIAQIKNADIVEKNRAIGVEDGIKTLIGALPEDVSETNVVNYLERLVRDEASTRANKIGEVGEGTVKDYIDDKVTEINGSPDSLIDRVAANEKAIEVLNGTETVEGSVAKTLKDAKDYTDTKNTAIDDRVAKLEATHATKESGLFKSVQEEVNEAINTFATNVSNDGVVNSFKELVDWVATHSSKAAEMVTAIGENTAAIEAENTRATEREDVIANNIATLENLVGGNKVDTKISDAINLLDADVTSNDDALVSVQIIEESGKVTDIIVTNKATFVDSQDIADMFA